MVINEEKELSYKQKYKADHFELFGHHVIFFKISRIKVKKDLVWRVTAEQFEMLPHKNEGIVARELESELTK